MDQALNAISAVGFPIVMCGGFCFFLFRLINKLMGQMDEFAESLVKFNGILIGVENRCYIIYQALNAISTFGFPIAMFGAFGYIFVFIVKKMLTQIDAFSASLDKFNDTLISMDKRLEHIENNINK